MLINENKRESEDKDLWSIAFPAPGTMHVFSKATNLHFLLENVKHNINAKRYLS